MYLALKRNIEYNGSDYFQSIQILTMKKSTLAPLHLFDVPSSNNKHDQKFKGNQ